MKSRPQTAPDKKIALQIQLPLFPAEATMVNHKKKIQKKDQTVFYFNGSMPIFHHHQNDLDSFRFITSQLVINGVCKQTEIVDCFEVSAISVKRWVKRYRESVELSDFVRKKKV